MSSSTSSTPIKCPMMKLAIVATVGFMAYKAFIKVKTYFTSSLKVIQVDIKPLAGIIDE